MFTVKATYNNETRKFTLKDGTFPSYSSICSHLVFPFRGSYYLSNLLFSPSESAMVVVGREVHDEAQYHELITPFTGRLWPNGLLRFTVVDEISRKPPGGSTSSLGQASLPLMPDLLTATPLPRQPHPASRDSMEVDSELTAGPPSNRYSVISQSCCSVAEGKSEVKELMSSFIRDFNNIMSSTFGDVQGAASTKSISANVNTELINASVSADEQKDTADTTAMGIPGAFFQAAPPASIASTEKPLHPGVTCDFCGKQIYGTRFKCDVCSDFDVCEECVEQRNAESTHRTISAQRGGFRHTVSAISKPRTVHTGVVCDFCDDTIVGDRHKCLDCPNFDLCDDCFPRAESDHGLHEFRTIRELERAIIVRRLQDRENEQKRLHRFGRYASSSSQPSAQKGASAVIHQANCDLCDSRIYGTRFKCLTCPDFDTCASCYRIVPGQHPRHTFVKLVDAQDLSPCDPNAFRKHSACCDVCGDQIRGIRYKCMHPECPDFDLCAKCEALPIEIHPSTHPLLKMRSPDTIIPTVYRVGGTTLITPPSPRPHTTGIAIATEPEPVKTDASVHAEVKPETVDAAVSTFPPNAEGLTYERSVLTPDLLTPSPLTPGLVLLDKLQDESSKLGENSVVQEMQESAAVIPLISTFLAKYTQSKDDALRAAFVSDVNIEDGRTFPAGAEFVKTWRMLNDGEMSWPETTRVVFVAGDRMPAFDGAPLSYHVGKVEPGVTVDINAADVKAPDMPGKYVGYWRLSDGTKPFGQSVWCDIMVADQSGLDCLHESLTASEVIMPEPSRAESISVDHPDSVPMPKVVFSTTAPATPAMSSGSPSSDNDSIDSLLDEFETASDEEFWEVSRELENLPRESADVGYVVLYDNDGTDDESR